MIKNVLLIVLGVIALVAAWSFVAVIVMVLVGAFVALWALGLPVKVSSPRSRGYIRWFTYYPDHQHRSTGPNFLRR